MSNLIESLRTFRRPWEYHTFHNTIASKQGFENFLMQRDNKEKLKTRLMESFEGNDAIRVQRALDLAEFTHGAQPREDGNTMHLNHVLRLALRTIDDSNKKNKKVEILDVLTDLLHDTEEDLQELQQVKQKEFKEAFNMYFKEEPLVDKLYKNVTAMNVYAEDGTKKPLNKYYEGLTKQRLWKRKIGDRKDSLIGDIAMSMTHKRSEKSLERVRKSAKKAAAIIPTAVEHDTSCVEEIDDLKQVIEYAQLFAKESVSFFSWRKKNGNSQQAITPHAQE